MDLPRMIRLHQQFDAPRLENVAEEVHAQLSRLNLGEKVRPGESVAITVGSRGIANIDIITKAMVDFFASLGAVPFIVPAMGSHGGGTAEGQEEIVAGYGITEATMNAKVRSSMETVIVDRTPQGIPVHFDKHAFEADHVVVAGRIKPHTGFVGDIESGLHKMMLIGLGKHEGAKIYHRAIADYSFSEIIQAVAGVVLEKCSVIAGVAIVENAYDETGLIEAVAPQDFYPREKELLIQSKKWMPRLPFDKADVLIVDKIGKDISGSGMDTNVVGRKFNVNEATDKDDVSCTRIFVRGLTDATHGNATGIGLAEFANTRTIAAIDQSKTAINAITGGHPSVAMIPISFPSDREVLEAALATVGMVEPNQARVVHIADTLHLKEVLVSEVYASEIEGRSDLKIVDGPTELTFDTDGNMSDVS